MKFLYIEEEDIVGFYGSSTGYSLGVHGPMSIACNSICSINTVSKSNEPALGANSLVLKLVNGTDLVIKNHGTVLDLHRHIVFDESLPITK